MSGTFEPADLKNEQVEQEKNNSKGKHAQHQDENSPGPVQIQPAAPFPYRRHGPSVVLRDMRAFFRGEGLIHPCRSPALPADLELAMGAGCEVPGVKGEGGPANPAALGTINDVGVFFSVSDQFFIFLFVIRGF